MAPLAAGLSRLVLILRTLCEVLVPAEVVDIDRGLSPPGGQMCDGTLGHNRRCNRIWAVAERGLWQSMAEQALGCNRAWAAAE